MALAGILTARPQLTRGSFLRSSHARIVAGFKLSASLASLTESNFVIWFTPSRYTAALRHTAVTDINSQKFGIFRGNSGLLLLLPVGEPSFEEPPISGATARPQCLDNAPAFFWILTERQARAVADERLQPLVIECS
jgi:hypothetical protein